MFFATKDKWYSIVTTSPDTDVGYRRLDSFFKSVGILMSNQLWEMFESSLSNLEQYFKQFASCDSEISLFTVRLTITGSQIRFEPPLGDLEAVVISIVEEMVSSVKEVPRIECKLFSSLKNEALYLTSMKFDDDRISEGRYLRSVITKNTVAPQKHLMSYDKYKALLSHKAEKRIDEFLREKHELEEYEAVFLNFIVGNSKTFKTCFGNK